MGEKRIVEQEGPKSLQKPKNPKQKHHQPHPQTNTTPNHQRQRVLRDPPRKTRAGSDTSGQDGKVYRGRQRYAENRGIEYQTRACREIIPSSELPLSSSIILLKTTTAPRKEFFVWEPLVRRIYSSEGVRYTLTIKLEPHLITEEGLEKFSAQPATPTPVTEGWTGLGKRRQGVVIVSRTKKKKDPTGSAGEKERTRPSGLSKGFQVTWPRVGGGGTPEMVCGG